MEIGPLTLSAWTPALPMPAVVRSPVFSMVTAPEVVCALIAWAKSSVVVTEPELLIFSAPAPVRLLMPVLDDLMSPALATLTEPSMLVA
ncbi:hypothetical protein D3C87_1359330 [compost metagenome]